MSTSYALMDVKTGSIIAGKNLDKKVEPASLPKSQHYI
jgi:D-alanyl-D-alanine carboxypeptidase